MDNPLTHTLDAPCKCCGTRSLTTVNRGAVRTFKCAICGDSWMVKERSDVQGFKQAEWVHHPEMTPTLSRTITMKKNPNNVPSDYADEEFTYYVGPQEAGMSRWFNLLDERRKTLKARVAN